MINFKVIVAALVLFPIAAPLASLHGQVNSLGACCIGTNECELRTSQGCIDEAGFFHGEGTVCEDECPSIAGTAFSYSGQLKEKGVPFTGLISTRFSLWDLPTGGQVVAGPLSFGDVPVQNGLFQAGLDFGAVAFGQNERWLEVAVCATNCNSPQDFTVLQPRQLITGSPFSLQTRGIVVNNEGNVGIRNSNPTNELDVSGVVKSRELHLTNSSGLPLARWDGSRIEPAPDQTSPTKSPTSVSTVAGDPNWTNPNGLIASDNSRATITMTSTGQGPSQALRITGFNFSVPVDAIVTQAIVYVKGSRSCACNGCAGQYFACEMNVPARLITDGDQGAQYFVNIAEGAEASLGIGLPAEFDWTAAMYNSSNFGIEISADLYYQTTCQGCGFGVPDCPCECFGCTGSGTASIDALTIELKYHTQVVVDRQWSLGMANPDSRFVIAPTGNLASPTITILTDGRVGFGGLVPFLGFELPNDNNLGQARGKAWFTYSSRRWKENIRRIPDALSKVLRLDGVMFDWAAANGGGADMGFVAEDVAKVIPELVLMEDEHNAAGMKYDRVTALAVEAIKELNSKIEARDREIAELLREKDTQIEELRRRLDQLESARP